MFLQDISLFQVSLLTVSLVAAWFAALSFKSWHRLRHIPGPSLASFSYLWLARVASSGKQYYIYRDLCDKYGPLVRVGPNELTTDDPEVIRRMSAVRSSYGKDTWYEGARFNPYHPTMFTTLDVPAHDKMKARTAGGYSGREAFAVEPGVDEQVRNLVSLIRRKYVSKPGTGGLRLLDFSNLSSFFTLDVITKAGFGQEFGYLNADEDLYDFLSGIRDHWPKLAVTVDVPWIRAILYSPTFLRFLGPRTTDKKGMGKLMGIANEIIGKRFSGEKKGEMDMLQSFMSHGLNQGECETECLFMVIAGSDTTASVVRITMLYLMANSQVYQRLKEEIAKAVRNGVSYPISVEEAKKIPYLQAVIYEGIRMRPPAPGLYPKSVPAGGDTIHGKYVPGGTAIGMNTSALLRSKRLFGDDADLFRPERFLEVDDARRIEMERDVDLAFGYGRWMCAGKPIAFMELNKVFFELLRAFDLQLANPLHPWDSKSFSVFVEQNMWVRVTETQQSVS